MPEAPRIPPQNLDAEKALLGSIMLRPGGIFEVVDIVTEQSFYSGRHRFIWKTMLELSSKNIPIDLLSLSSRLTEKTELEAAGGASYLAELAASVPSATNLVHYAEIIQKKFLMRGIIDAAAYLGELGYAEAEDVETLLDRAEKRIFEITNRSALHTFVELRETLGEAWERLDRLHKSRDELRGIPTGFPELDNKLAGFQKSDLIILAARPSMGKTSLALDIARMAATGHAIPIGIFSLEMSSQQLVDRMLAAESRVDAWKLRTGRLNAADEFGKIRDSLDRLSKAPIYIDDQPANNILKMRSVARRLKSEKGLQMIIVDYLQLMAPTTARHSDNLVQQVTEISRSLKHLARELDIPVLALSQLSRAVEARGGRPRLSDLRDSGCLAGDTLIIRADTGERVKLKSLVGKRDIPVFALDKEYRLQKVPVSNVFSSGRKKLYELSTRSGKRIRASANHPFLTFQGWSRLDALSPKEFIAMPRALKPEASDYVLPEAEAILLAHLLGDGCILPRQPFHYTSADEENIRAVSDAAHALFGIVPRQIRQKNWWHLYLPSPYRLTHGKRHPITLWFDRLGLSLVRSYEKRVPEFLFRSGTAIIALFLKHLWATDGNISFTRLKDRKPAGAIYYSTTSRGLAEDVQSLLLRLGIWSTIAAIPQGTHRQNYHVRIQSSPVQLQFCRMVGCFGARGEIIPSLITALEAITPNTNTDVIPKEAWDLLVSPARRDANMNTREFSDGLGITHNGAALTMTGISRKRLARIAAVLADKNLAHLAESDVYWDQITSITPLGEEEVFDAMVPGLHNFVANDFLVHNSIEQDADVVMFIHREDKYKEDSDRPNIAEILIEKHRNGPTGKVELYFDEKKATFLPLEKSTFADFEREEKTASEPF